MAITKSWMPKALISWGEADQSHTIYGSELWDTEDEAILDASYLAIEWIDQKRHFG